ncbi:ISL3 family transposase [Streptomyces sp. NPDC001728]|uniref:ISL3 family transposase n=1 Tax=Streptomyces sp. NPDC001728 TaxID=3154396 RepID=UPI003316D879
MGKVVSGLSVLVVKDVTDGDGGDAVVVTARTRDVAVPCPVCGMPTAKVHGYHCRSLADVPVDGRPVVDRLRVRRLVCPVPPPAADLPRADSRTAGASSAPHGAACPADISMAREFCGRAAARLAGLLALPVSRGTTLRHLRRLPLPRQAVPQVIGVDDFALRRRYATIITEAETGRRVAVLPDRDAATPESWLREHAGIEVVCRDGSATYAEAVRRALPDAVQFSDLWHLWRNLCDKVLLEVRAHAGCWATINPPRPGGVREQTTRERRNKVYNLLGQAVGLLDRSRRLGLALNTVKRYARMPEPPAPRITPAYRPTLVAPYRDHLRCRRAEEPAVPATHLLEEIRELGYTGSANLLVRHLNQGRAEGDRPVTTPHHAGRLLLTDPEILGPKETALLKKITAACSDALADLVRGFAAVLKPAEGNDAILTEWINTARCAGLPHLRSLINGLESDRAAVDTGLTEGVNTRTRRITTQMHGRAGFDLLRHRILLL